MFKSLSIFLPLFLFSSFLFAGSNTKSDNNLYAALKWEIGGNTNPEIILGLRKAEIDSSGDVRGNDISLSFNLIGEKQFKQTRFKLFNGKEAVQTEASIGYDLSNGIFFGPSINAPHLNAGLDFYPTKKEIKSYFLLHTIQKYKMTNSETTSEAQPGPGGQQEVQGNPGPQIIINDGGLEP